MFWADRVAKEIIDSGKHKPYWVDDMKTPSGFAHVGSMMGPVVHSMVYRALKDAGVDTTFTFVINNLDPVDGLSEDLKDSHSKYLGYPLKLAPSPDPKFESMADYYAHDFINSIRSLGVEAEIIYSWDLYKEGKFDSVIREALDNAEKIQDIYQKVSGSDKRQSGWLPFQVICENCQKLGTTRVYAWDGEKVSYKCEPNMVKWAEGCGHEGKTSPFGGTGKLPWKVDWPAHWKVIGITVEGAGKDHASAGGSYDIAMTIVEDVFSYPKPFKLPYEFILIGGRKMSSSKGLGLKAHDLVKIVPPELGRFLFARTDLARQSNFDPVETMAIPDLFDDYDKAWLSFVNGEDETLARTFALSQMHVLPKKEKIFLPRFRDVANYLQQKSIDVFVKFAQIKGSELSKVEKDVLTERIKYAEIWLKNYAPQEDVVSLSESVPSEAKTLSDVQKGYLKEVLNLLSKDLEPDDLQVMLYNAAKEQSISTKEAFAALYLSLIGKNHGPKAAWLILSNLELVKKRLSDVIDGEFNSSDDKKYTVKNLFKPEIFSIEENVKERFPSMSVGIAVIKGVSIMEKNADLENEKAEFLRELEGLTTEKINEYEEIKSYRQIYRDTGVDWHSRRPSPEALLRRFALGKGIYSINTCVDAYNLVVMKNRISVGAFDLDQIKFPTVLRFAKEGERIHLLGDELETKYKEGEIAYFDVNGGYNMDFNYRDARRTAVTLATKNLYINTEGVYGIDPYQVEKALKEACDIIIKYCGGEVEEFGMVAA